MKLNEILPGDVSLVPPLDPTLVTLQFLDESQKGKGQLLTIIIKEWAEPVMDLFAPKFYSPIQNNNGPNISDKLNFYCPSTKLREGNFLSHFCLSVSHSLHVGGLTVQGRVPPLYRDLVLTPLCRDPLPATNPNMFIVKHVQSANRQLAFHWNTFLSTLQKERSLLTDSQIVL